MHGSFCNFSGGRRSIKCKKSALYPMVATKLAKVLKFCENGRPPNLHMRSAQQLNGTSENFHFGPEKRTYFGPISQMDEKQTLQTCAKTSALAELSRSTVECIFCVKCLYRFFIIIDHMFNLRRTIAAAAGSAAARCPARNSLPFLLVPAKRTIAAETTLAGGLRVAQIHGGKICGIFRRWMKNKACRTVQQFLGTRLSLGTNGRWTRLHCLELSSLSGGSSLGARSPSRPVPLAQ